MNFSLRSVRCEMWLGSVDADFRVCITTIRMLYFLQGYLFRVLDTTPILLLSELPDFPPFIFPHHIPDKCVGMFSCLQTICRLTRPTEYLGWRHPCSCKHTHVITTKKENELRTGEDNDLKLWRCSPFVFVLVNIWIKLIFVTVCEPAIDFLTTHHHKITRYDFCTVIRWDDKM